MVDVVSFGVAAFFAVLALVAWGRISKLTARIGELEEELAKVNPSSTPISGKNPAIEPKPKPRPAPPPPSGAEGKEVYRHAVKMIREAKELTKHLGFDSVTDMKNASVYRVNLPLSTDLDKKAVEWLTGKPFDCIHEIRSRKEDATIMLDVSKSIPK